jgi:hypothetical protein
MSGPTGPTGPTGFQGPNGLQGLRGATGLPHGLTGPAYGSTTAIIKNVTASSSIYLTPQNFGQYFTITSNSGSTISVYFPFYNPYYPPGFNPSDPTNPDPRYRPTETTNELFPSSFWYGNFWFIKNNYVDSGNGTPSNVTLNIQTSTGSLRYSNAYNVSSITLAAKSKLMIIYTSNGYIGV